VSSEFTFEELIERKRDGHAHTAEEIDRIVLGYTDGEMPDYQMAAWLMAAFLNGLDADETVWLTDAMVRSGRQVDLSSIPGVKVDKHSTGGVADTTTLVLAPMVAACGAPVAKMSGRGLGHTGGTLDKLEAIPGYSVELSPEAFVSQVRDVGVAVIAQSPDVDPADKKIYALRDVTATVPSIPLIVGSIISKKIAGGADAILLDVKVGSGAFMKSEQDARALAAELRRVGHVLGRDVVCVMSDMSQPLGMAVGNSLEVREAIETLRGEGPAELTDLCVALGAKMLVLARVCNDQAEGQQRCWSALADGTALSKFQGRPDRLRRRPAAGCAHRRRRLTWGSALHDVGIERGSARRGRGAIQGIAQHRHRTHEATTSLPRAVGPVCHAYRRGTCKPGLRRVRVHRGCDQALPGFPRGLPRQSERQRARFSQPA